MPVPDSNLARRFAHGISKVFSTQFRTKLLNSAPGYEHKAVAPQIHEYLDEFLKAQGGESAQLPRRLDWEGNDRKRSDKRLHYPIVGIWSFPDAGVLDPFRCAFEFDREGRRRAGFKDALMETSVHVLSGAYEACVLVYILRRGSRPRKFYGDRSVDTRKLIRTLQAAGLYVTLIRK